MLGKLMQEKMMDPVAQAKFAVLSDAETPPSRPSLKFLVAVVIVTAGAAYLMFGASLGAYIRL